MPNPSTLSTTPRHISPPHPYTHLEAMAAFTDLKTLYSKPPPPFGKESLQLFAMDPKYINLNNGESSQISTFFLYVLMKNIVYSPGSYGTPPKAVLQYAFEVSQEIENNPERFHRYGYQDRLNEARSQVASLIGAQTDECYIVANATAGVNTVLRNFSWDKDDIIITCAYHRRNGSRSVLP